PGLQRVLHGALGSLVRAGTALAALGAGGGERLSDMIPGGLGRIAGMAGADLRRLQTGLSHHYYTLLMAGLALVMGLLILGG
ncbi:NADH-quinone oxidoreductase subunit L, partial [Aquicoccus sp. SCR17]|nr:NADH-quinone oxidoreductase subunit L [Carideicomes alvinocaridis]